MASDDSTTEQLVKHAHEAALDSGQELDDAVFRLLARRISYLHGDVTDAALYRSLAAEIGDRQRPVYYLEVPPSLFGPIVDQLGAAKLLRDGRVAVEKPFGHDLASARELDARLHRLLRESQILRVYYFLGKEPVIEPEYLRFANFGLAELWDRRSVSCVQITMAEDFGIEGRGRFYDSVGALRDMVQITTCCRSWPWSPWTCQPAPAPTTRRTRRRRCSAPCRPPTRSTTCAASTRGTPTSPAWRRVRPPRPTWRCGWRSTTGAGPTSQSSCGPARRCRTR